MSNLDCDIVTPGRPEIREVSAGVYAYIQPDGTWWINNTGFLTRTGPLEDGQCDAPEAYLTRIRSGHSSNPYSD